MAEIEQACWADRMGPYLNNRTGRTVLPTPLPGPEPTNLPIQRGGPAVHRTHAPSEPTASLGVSTFVATCGAA